MEMIDAKNFEILRGLNLCHQAEKNMIKEFVVEMDTTRWQAVEACKERFLVF